MFDNSEVRDVNIISPAKRNSPNFPSVGGIELVGYKRIKDEKAKDFNCLVITFKDPKTNAKLEHREFEPKPKEGKTPEQFKKQLNLVVSRIAHITRAFVSQEEFESIKKQETWTGYLGENARVLGVQNEVPTRAKGQLMDLKVVLRENQGKYYSALPNVPPFISTANHPKSLTFDPNYDLVEIPTNKPDAPGSSANQNDFSAQSFSANAGSQPATESGAKT